MEEGKDTKKIIEEHYKMMKEYKRYRESTERRIDRLIAENIKLENKYRETSATLYKLQNDVAKPLIVEISKREKEIIDLQKEVKERTINLKILFSMIKSPKMCSIVHRTQSKLFTKK